jgi:hypothetical protein
VYLVCFIVRTKRQHSLYNDHPSMSPCTWEDNIKIGIQETGWAVWTGSIWLRIGDRGGLLWTRWWTFGFHEMNGIHWLTKKIWVSERLHIMKLVTGNKRRFTGRPCVWQRCHNRVNIVVWQRCHNCVHIVRSLSALNAELTSAQR